MAETLSYDPTPEAEVLTEEEQDSLQVGQELKEQQEQLLAGKYKSAEELEKAYVELQKKLGEGSDEEEQGEAEPSEEEAPEVSPAQSLITDASAEYAEKGQLSEEMMSKFSEMSSQDLVQAYMEMQANAPQAETAEPVELSDNDINTIKNSVGGEAEYDKVIDWATTNLSESQIEAYDDIISTGNTDVIQMMVDGLKAKYDSANGFEGRMLTGKAANNSGDVFRSQEEVVSAIADPRYDRDPAYRNDVLEKLERSDVTFR
tara:strand:+ start:1164 stop:1943 length:780 start_codon:yes stop_codon:yes gene_type:complete